MTNIESISEMSQNVSGCRFNTCIADGQCAAVAAAINGLGSGPLQMNEARLRSVIEPFKRINCPNAEEIIGKLK